MSLYSYVGKEEKAESIQVSGLESIWREIKWDETYGTIME